MCRSRTDHEICPIIDDNAMTRRRGLTLTLDQLTRTNPLRVPLSLYHPQSVVQCYCTYMCQVNSHIHETGLYTGWIVPVGMQFHDYMAKQVWMNVDVLNQWHAALDNLGIIPSTIRKLSFFFIHLAILILSIIRLKKNRKIIKIIIVKEKILIMYW